MPETITQSEERQRSRVVMLLHLAHGEALHLSETAGPLSPWGLAAGALAHAQWAVHATTPGLLDDTALTESGGSADCLTLTRQAAAILRDLPAEDPCAASARALIAVADALRDVEAAAQ